MPVMIRLRNGTILEVLEERPGALELSVEVDGESGSVRAVAYPDLVGPLSRGDRVLLSGRTVTVLDGVVSVEPGRDRSEPVPGRA